MRHGESFTNTGVWTNKPHDVLLTEKGEEQVREAAKEIVTQPNLIIVSPAKRAQDSALPIIQKWPNAPVETWPIQEFHYLSPEKYCDNTIAERRIAIENYWQRADPFYSDGEDAETFAHFIKRVEMFHQRLSKQQGFVVAVGHGQFFKAYELSLQDPCTETAEWMREFRKLEKANPMKNGEMIKLHLSPSV